MSSAMMPSESSIATGGDSTYRTNDTFRSAKSNNAPIPSAIDPYQPDPHPIVSPASGFENFFISPELRTNHVSAYALANKIRSNNSKGGSSVRSGTSTIATDDFASACEDSEQMPPEPDRSLFGKDILILSRNPVIPEDDYELDSEEENEEDDNMSTTTTTPTTTTPTTTEGLNATQVVYEKVKDVWTWGKTLPVISKVEELTEAVATKISGVTLADMDGGIKPHLAGFDTTYLNPAISALVGFVVATAGKSEETLKPIIDAMSKPLKMIKKTPETASSPELTTAPVAAN